MQKITFLPNLDRGKPRQMKTTPFPSPMSSTGQVTAGVIKHVTVSPSCSQISTVLWSKCTQRARTGCTRLYFCVLQTCCPRQVSMGKIHSYKMQKMYMLLSTHVASISTKTLISHLQYKNERFSSLYHAKNQIIFTSSIFTCPETQSGFVLFVKCSKTEH